MKILFVISEYTGIGNLILLSPAIKALLTHVKGVEIFVYGNSLVGQVLSGLRLVPLRKLEPGMAFDYVFVLFFAEKLLHEHEKILTQISGGNIAYLEFGPPWDEHEAGVYMKIPRALGWEGKMPSPYCDCVDVTPPWPPGENVVVISDTASPREMWQRKRWPYFKQLAALLYHEGYSIALVGGAYEAKIFDKTGWVPHYNLLGQLTLPQTAGLIKKSAFFVGNDSGPAHISAAVGAATFAIFGATSLTKNTPLGKRVAVISLKLDCQPCQPDPSRWNACTHWKCMRNLKPYAVLAAIRESALFKNSLSSSASR